MKSVIDGIPNVADKSGMLKEVMREGQRMLADGLQDSEWKAESEELKAKGDVKGELLLLYWQYLEDKFKCNLETTYDHCLIKLAEKIR